MRKDGQDIFSVILPLFNLYLKDSCNGDVLRGIQAESGSQLFT